MPPRWSVVAYVRDDEALPHGRERAEAVALHLEQVQGLNVRTGVGWNPYDIKIRFDQAPPLDTLEGEQICNSEEEAVALEGALYLGDDAQALY